MRTTLVDVADGLWLWRTAHPAHEPGGDWEPTVTSACVEAGDEVVLLDPLWPADDADELWARLEAKPPTTVVVLKPDHVRSVDRFAAAYGPLDALGPSLFWPDSIPETPLKPIDPDMTLACGLVTLHDGRGRMETPVYLPEQRTIVVADALTAPEGELRVWATRWMQERTLPALRAWLELPFEQVVVSHGEPVHDRAAFEAALERPPWSVDELS